MNKSNIAFLLASLLMCASAWAVKVPNLYETELGVVSQSPDVRADAIRKAFREMLIKVTGNQDIDKNRRVADNIDRADYFVQEYSYSSPTVNSSSYKLRVKFNDTDVKRMLKRAGVNYWGEMRPLILVWLATVNDKEQADILGVETPGGVLNIFKQQGQRFGLPLIFPMMDVADMSMINPANITSVSMPDLQRASTRYAPDAMLVGTMVQTKDGYEAHWNLVLGEKVWDWSISAPTAETIIANVLDDVSQTMSRKYEARANADPSTWLTLEVSNIGERDELNQLIRFLKQLTPVQEVELAQVNGSQVSISVQVQGDLETFRDNASIGQHLMLRGQEAGTNKITYEWIR